MNGVNTRDAVRSLRHLVRSTTEAGDGPLWDRYVREGDAEAFAVLVRRHGPMVFGVCRRMLRCHDAEDAFQATFLSLARQARSLRDGDCVAGWLHRVATRIAGRVRHRTATESIYDLPSPRTAEDPAIHAAWRELCGVLDKELSQLSDPLRAPLVLCYLEGATRDEAARRLGWSLSTLQRRLERGRSVLRARLAASGLAPAALASVLLLPDGMQAAVSPRLSEVAAAYAAPTAAAPPTITALADGARRGLNLLFTKAVLLVAGVGVCLVVGRMLPIPESLWRQTQAPAPTPAVLPAAPPAETPGPRHDRFGDPLPPGALARFGTVRYRHGGGFNDAALSPDGKWLVAASEVGVTLFEVDSGRPIHRLRQSEVPNGFDATRSLVAFSPDSKTFASLAANGSVRLWDVTTGREQRRLGTPMGAGNLLDIRRGGLRGLAPPNPAPALDPGPAASVVFADSNKELLIKDMGATVRFLDALTGTTVRSLELQGNLIGLSPDRKTLIATSYKRMEVILHAASTGRVLKRISSEEPIETAALALNGKTLVIATNTGRIRVTDVESGKTLFKTEPPAIKARPTVVAVTPDGKTILVGDKLGLIRRWERESGKELPPLKKHYGWVTGLHFASGGDTLVSTAWDGTFRRWNLTTGREIPSGDGYGGHIHAVLSPNGRFVAVGDAAGRLDLWEAPTGNLIRGLRTSGPGVGRLAFAPHGNRLAAGLFDGRVVLWDTRTWKETTLVTPQPTIKDGEREWYDALTFNPDGRLLLFSSRNKSFHLWDIEKQSEVWKQPGEGRAAWSPGGKTLATGGWDKTLSFRDASTGAVRSTLTCASSALDAITFSPDGSLLATAQRDGAVSLRDPETGHEIRRIGSFSDVIWEISFSPDGKWLFAAVSDHSVRLVEVASGQEVLRLDGHDGRTYHGQFGPDGKTALSSAWDQTALFWSLRPRGIPRGQNAETLWDHLRSPKAEEAYRAAWALIDDPASAVAILRSKVKVSSSKLDLPQLRQWIADLDHEQFSTRDAAEKALGAHVEPAEKFLREAMKTSTSAEQKRRLEGLLGRLKREPTPDDDRRGRAVQILELCGTNEARKLLEEWAKGPSGAWLTRDAQAALGRSRQENPTGPLGQVR